MKAVCYKKIIHIFILIITLFTTTSIFADTVITCDQNSDALSHQFAAHWTHDGPSWWSSWAHDMMSGKLFVGGMRTVTNQLPVDQNPHLTFAQANASYDPEHEMFVATCIYHIGNSKMFDADDGLEMRVFLIASNCTASGTTITCEN